MPNQVVATKGLERSAQLILDDITHIAVGTGTATPTSGDVKLATETQRNTPTKAIRQGARLHIRTLFSNADLPATMEEIGWFMNGTGTIDSGELLVRALLNFVKGNDDLIAIVQLTIKE